MSKFMRTMIAGTALAGSMSMAAPAIAGADPFVGQILFYPYNFCPRSTVAAQGQILAISSNTALFSLLGTTYGGNGTTTFALPDLRGRGVVNQGQGPGLSDRLLGEVGGAESLTLLTTEMPSHTHVGSMRGYAQNADTDTPVGNSFSTAANGFSPNAAPTPASYLNAAAATVATAGGSQPIAFRSPYLTLTPCIALQGIFPARN